MSKWHCHSVSNQTELFQLVAYKILPYKVMLIVQYCLLKNSRAINLPGKVGHKSF